MILIADGECLQRELIRLFFKQSGDNNLLTAGSYLEAVTHLKSDTNIRLLMIDLKVPGMHGAASVSEICNTWPDVPVLIVSANDHVLSMKSCMESGAAGFVSKCSGIDVLKNAVEQVLTGQCFFPNQVISGQTLKFSRKQMEILYLLTEGCSNQEIAKRTFLTNGTVKQYVSDILSKMEVDNRVKAAIQARKILGL